jgi:hypothetical protein
MIRYEYTTTCSHMFLNIIKANYLFLGARKLHQSVCDTGKDAEDGIYASDRAGLRILRNWCGISCPSKAQNSSMMQVHLMRGRPTALREHCSPRRIASRRMHSVFQVPTFCRSLNQHHEYIFTCCIAGYCSLCFDDFMTFSFESRQVINLSTLHRRFQFEDFTISTDRDCRCR